MLFSHANDEMNEIKQKDNQWTDGGMNEVEMEMAMDLISRLGDNLHMEQKILHSIFRLKHEKF